MGLGFLSFAKQAKQVASAIAPVVESLEQRRMLSVTLNDSDTLVVRGTKNDDTITIVLKAGDENTLLVTDNGEQHEFDLGDVDEIRVKAGKGNDSVKIDESNGAITLEARLDGEKGNDTLVSASGNDRVDGGQGDDEVDSGAGDDRIRGRGGDDDIECGSGEDSAYGDSGHDSVNGGGGKDRLRGNGGIDTFHKRDVDGRDVKDRGGKDNAKEIISVGQLPDGVKTALLNTYGEDAKIIKVELEDDEADEVLGYEVKVRVGRAEYEGTFAADGTFIEGDLTLDMLPDAVQDAFEAEFPNAVVREIDADDEDDEEGGDVIYKIEFRTADGVKGEAEFAPDGTLLDSEIEGENDDDDDDDDDDNGGDDDDDNSDDD